MKKPSPFESKDEEFIRQNWKTLPVRRMASTLSVKRTDVEEFVRSLREASALEAAGPLTPSRERLWLAAFFLIALLLRLYYLDALGHTPFFEPLSSLLDDGVYDARGQSIAGGDWIGRGWPWLIYLTPLYPYFLGAVYRLIGHSIGAIHVIQTFLGAFTPVLVYRLAKEAFAGRRTAILAGLLSASYVPFIYYENLLSGESLSLFLSLCALFLLARALNKEEGAKRPVFSAGLLFGIAALLRPHLLIAVVFPALYLGYIWAFERRRKTLGAAVAILLMTGAAAGIAPITLKNYLLYHDFVPISAHGGANLYMSNNPLVEKGMSPIDIFGSGVKEMPDRAVALAEKAEARTLKPSEVSAYWLARTVDYIRASPAGFCRVLLLKAMFFFNRYEFPDMRDMLFTAEFLPFLRPAAFQYGVVTALALCGVWFCLPGSSAAARLLFSFAFGYAGAVVVFHVTSRYRVPVIPIFILFAAAALDHVWEAWLKRDRRELSKFSLLAALAAAFVFYPLPTPNFSRSYNSLGIFFDGKGRWAEAERCYMKALQLDPRFPGPYHNLARLYHFRDADDAKAAAFENKFNALQEYQRARGAKETGL